MGDSARCGPWSAWPMRKSRQPASGEVRVFAVAVSLSTLCTLGGRGGRGGQVRCSWGCAWWRPADGVVCSIPPCQSRAATTKDIIFPLHLNKVKEANSLTGNWHRVCACVSRLGWWGPNQRTTTRNSQNAGAGVVGLAHACLALSFCHRITQRVLQPQHGALWLCIVPAASSRTAASFSSRSARRDETWSSVELIVS